MDVMFAAVDPLTAIELELGWSHLIGGNCVDQKCVDQSNVLKRMFMHTTL